MKPISHAVIVVILPLVMVVVPLADRPASRSIQTNQPRVGEVSHLKMNQ